MLSRGVGPCDLAPQEEGEPARPSAPPAGHATWHRPLPTGCRARPWAGQGRVCAPPKSAVSLPVLETQALGPLGSEPRLAVGLTESLLDSPRELPLVCHPGCGSCRAGPLGGGEGAGPLPAALVLPSPPQAAEPTSAAGLSAVAMTTKHCLGVPRGAHSVLKKSGHLLKADDL